MSNLVAIWPTFDPNLTSLHNFVWTLNKIENSAHCLSLSRREIINKLPVVLVYFLNIGIFQNDLCFRDACKYDGVCRNFFIFIFVGIISENSIFHHQTSSYQEKMLLTSEVFLSACLSSDTGSNQSYQIILDQQISSDYQKNFFFSNYRIVIFLLSYFPFYYYFSVDIKKMLGEMSKYSEIWNHLYYKMKLSVCISVCLYVWTQISREIPHVQR